jgi:hypothetical protein
MPIDRRAALISIARAGALILPTAGLAATAALATTADPIFAAIERHRASYLRFLASINAADEVLAKKQGRTVTAAEEAENDDALHAEIELFLALLATPPQTKAGAQALIRYVSRSQFDIGNVDHALEALFAALLRSPLIEGEA